MRMKKVGKEGKQLRKIACVHPASVRRPQWAALIKPLRQSIKKTLRPANGKFPLSREKRDRHQRERREKDWQRELPNIFDEAWRGHTCVFGNCFHEQIRRVADVTERAKKGGA